eukprot:3600362-Amphidinium_carterae.2
MLIVRESCGQLALFEVVIAFGLRLVGVRDACSSTTWSDLKHAGTRHNCNCTKRNLAQAAGVQAEQAPALACHPAPAHDPKKQVSPLPNLVGSCRGDLCERTCSVLGTLEILLFNRETKPLQHH